MTHRIPKGIREIVSLRDGGICQARLSGCFGVASEIHHIKSRARRGSYALINLLHVCPLCHKAITEHRPGTDRFRTRSWQKEGERESDERL